VEGSYRDGLCEEIPGTAPCQTQAIPGTCKTDQPQDIAEPFSQDFAAIVRGVRGKKL